MVRLSFDRPRKPSDHLATGRVREADKVPDKNRSFTSSNPFFPADEEMRRRCSRNHSFLRQKQSDGMIWESPPAWGRGLKHNATIAHRMDPSNLIYGKYGKAKAPPFPVRLSVMLGLIE
jgi:hypothetical protein